MEKDLVEFYKRQQNLLDQQELREMLAEPKPRSKTYSNKLEAGTAMGEELDFLKGLLRPE
jgi:hypothetical protein